MEQPCRIRDATLADVPALAECVIVPTVTAFRGRVAEQACAPERLLGSVPPPGPCTPALALGPGFAEAGAPGNM